MWYMFLVLFTTLIGVISQKYVDLGRPFDENSVTYPLDTPNLIPFSLKTIEEGDEAAGGGWMSIKGFCMPEHMGTSIDAPFHICRNGWKLDEIPFERYFVEGILLDISEKSKKDPNAELTLNDMYNWVERYGPIPNRSIILLRTGWADKYHNHQEYFGYKDPAHPLIQNFPGFSGNVTEYFVSLKELSNTHVYGIGTDCLSLDVGNTQTFPVHTTTCAANIYGIENMNNLEKLPPKGFKVIVMPLKLTNGTGGPCRVYAEIPE